MSDEYELVKVDAYTTVSVPKKPEPPKEEPKPKAKKGVKDGNESEKAM